jgi:O-antigen/teichoic acid export membrane protein
MPIRGSTGLLTAQERYHLTQWIQGVGPWVNLGLFYLLLARGWGVMAYVWASWAAQLAAWGLFILAIRRGPAPPRFRLSLISWERLRSLFGFSAHVSVQGFVEAAVTQLPTLVLAKLGGVAMAPVYTFTNRAPRQLASLTRKVVWAFYPRLLRLQVEGKKEEFLAKHRQVSTLTSSISLIAGGGVLAFNQTVVEFLAGKDYYGGAWVTAVMAGILIIEPISRLYACLTYASGNLSGMAPISLLMLPVSAGFAVLGFRWAGLAGLATVPVLLPLALALLGYVSGTRNCGFRRDELSKTGPAVALFGCGAAAVACLLAGNFAEHRIHLSLGGRATSLPGPVEMIVPSLLMLGGLVGLVRTARKIRA